MSLSLYRRCFLCPDGRPRLPHQRGEQRMFQMKTVCLMCHRFRQDSFGHLEGVSRLRLRVSPVSLPVYAWPSGSTFLLDPTVFQTVLASGTSSLPPAGTTSYLGDGRLLETGLPGCPYRLSDFGGLPFSDENPAYGLEIHHPRFLEFVGVPESARHLDCSPTFWVDQLGKEQAMVAAINLQRDAGVMLSNLQILSQFATALHRMSFSMMALGIGQSLFPGTEVDDLSPAP